MTAWTKHAFNTLLFPFREHMQEALNILHLNKLDDTHPVFTIDTEQKSLFHKLWYSYVDNHPEFVIMYGQFIRKYVIPLLSDKDILYQTKPTVRFHLKNNHAVSNWHKDSVYNHSREEINIFVPLTRAFGNNTIYIESEEDKGDFAEMPANYGEFVIFPGATHMHGNKLNDTGFSRVSFDFRILPKKYYIVDESKTTRVQGRKFIIGDYWSEL